MPDVDLKATEERVNESRKDFLRAVDAYDSDDGKQIIEKFLAEFLSPERERSEIAHAHAKEAIEQIKAFGNQRISMTENIGIALTMMQQAVLHLAIGVMSGPIETFSKPPQATGGSPMERLREQTARLGEAQRNLQATGKEAETKACEIGGKVALIQEMAASVLRMRTLTLKAFKKENLDLSLQDLIKRIRKELEEAGTDKAFEEACEFIIERMQEVLEIVIEQAPVIRVLNVLRKIGRVLGPKEIDTSPGGTDEMLKLLDQLRRESAALEALTKAQREATKELEDIVHAPSRKAS
jgi:hypothetical protein